VHEQVFWRAARKNKTGVILRPQFEQVFWRAARNTGSIFLRPQTPLSYPSKKKTVQNDVTLIHSSNLLLKKRCGFCFKQVNRYGRISATTFFLSFVRA
jgi:hypothetical protein